MVGAFVITTALALAPPSSCETGTKKRIDVTLKLEVLRAASISPQVVSQTLDAARAVLAPYGIKVDLVKTSAVDDTPPFGTGNLPEASSGVRAPAPISGKGAPAQARLNSAAEATRALVRKSVPHRNGHIVVVMTPKLASPDSVIRRALGDLRALTLVDNGEPLAKLVGLHGRAPLVLLGMAEEKPATGRTLAHELGHVVGLPHRNALGALMHPHDDSCPAVLRANELLAFERFDGLSSHRGVKLLEADETRP